MNQNPYSDRSPYVFFNTFPRSQMRANAALAGLSGVGIVFDSTPFLHKTLYMSDTHSAGQVSREGVTTHRFVNTDAMNRVLRTLSQRSMSVAQSNRNTAYRDADTARVFQEVFTRYNPLMSDVRYLRFSTAPSPAIVDQIHQKCPHASIVVHVPSEASAIKMARHTFETVRVEGKMEGLGIGGDFVRKRIRTTLDTLAPYTATSPTAKQLAQRLRRALVRLERQVLAVKGVQRQSHSYGW